MKWTKCNHRHALRQEYDYFVQGCGSQTWPWYHPRLRDLIGNLRVTYGMEGSNVAFGARNPAWHLDRKRNRLWVRSDVFMMIQLQGRG